MAPCENQFTRHRSNATDWLDVPTVKVAVPQPVISTAKVCPPQLPLQVPLVAQLHPISHVTLDGEMSQVAAVTLFVRRSVPPLMTRLLRLVPETEIAELVRVVTS